VRILALRGEDILVEGSPARALAAWRAPDDPARGAAAAFPPGTIQAGDLVIWQGRSFTALAPAVSGAWAVSLLDPA
jgi:hypothetical protein